MVTLQGVLTPFDRLEGFERKVQSGPAEVGGSADQDQPSAGTAVFLAFAHQRLNALLGLVCGLPSEVSSCGQLCDVRRSGKRAQGRIHGRRFSATVVKG